MKKTFLTCLIVALLLLAGCSAKKEEAAKPKNQALSSYPVTIVDTVGHKVEIAAKPKRIVSLAPANTEILFALGAGDRVVGVTEYCNYPKEATEITKIGGFANPNIEKIIALNPDLVIAAGTLQDDVVKKLESLKIPILLFDAKSLTETMKNVETIGTAVGELTATVEVTGKMRSKINEVEAKLKNTQDVPVVFYEVYNQPLITAGVNTFINDLIVKSKGKNAAAGINEDYPQFSLEKLIDINPQVYIAVEGSNSQPGDIKARPGWSGISAIANSKVYIVNDDLVSRPGPRIVDGFESIAKAIHPEAFE